MAALGTEEHLKEEEDVQRAFLRLAGATEVLVLISHCVLMQLCVYFVYMHICV